MWKKVQSSLSSFRASKLVASLIRLQSATSWFNLQWIIPRSFMAYWNVLVWFTQGHPFTLTESMSHTSSDFVLCGTAHMLLCYHTSPWDIGHRQRIVRMGEKVHSLIIGAHSNGCVVVCPNLGRRIKSDWFATPQSPPFTCNITTSHTTQQILHNLA